MTIWKDSDPLHSVEMFNEELSFAHENVQHIAQSELLNDSLAAIFDTMDGVFALFVEWIRERLPPKMSNALLSASGAISDLLVSALFVTKIFILRLSMLFLSLPLFLLVAWAALVDGMTERQLRIAGGARESNVIFDFASNYAFLIVVGTWVLYLSSPITINPLFAILPGAFLFFLLLRSAAKMYKKYL